MPCRHGEYRRRLGHAVCPPLALFYFFPDTPDNATAAFYFLTAVVVSFWYAAESVFLLVAIGNSVG
jgi:hypothetical protein